jgi:hypothetical protein
MGSITLFIGDMGEGALHREGEVTIKKKLSGKRTKFHTYKLKEERSYKTVIKIKHYCINPEENKTEIKKLWHTVTNIWNSKHSSTVNVTRTYSMQNIYNSAK